MKLKTLISTTVLAASTFAASAGTVYTNFDLFDHPGGAINPQAYGLRLDGFGGDLRTTFSFENGAGDSTVRLTVVDDGMSTRVHISGVITGNSASGGTAFGTYMIDVWYDVGTSAEGYEAAHATAGSSVGGITGLSTTGASPLADGEFMELFSMSDGSGTFRFFDDGHRLDGDDSTWVGRGWVDPNSSGSTGVNDFLFTGVYVVPLPTAALAGFGMLGCIGAYRRIRR